MDFFNLLKEAVFGLAASSGFALFFKGDNYLYIIMIGISLLLIYLAIVKNYEPLLLLPIAFGMLLANLPGSNLMLPPTASENGGLLWYLYQGDELGIFPPLIFLGVGAMTDFGPLIANPRSILLGGAAQMGIFAAFLGALLLGFTPQEASCIGIIGGADGPTTIFLSNKLAPHMLATVAVAAYSYMALVPIIQPPVMKLLTTKEERAIKMEQLRVVSKTEKIIFPIAVTILVVLLIPDCAPLIGMLMLGNLFKESMVTEKLARAASEYMMYIITIFLGVTVGATARADTFLNPKTLGVFLLGLVAFASATACGILLGKIMCKATHGKVNPLIGAAGVSAVPMAARVAQKVGASENPNNYLLMHAMGPNVAGVIGSAVVAGVFLSLYKI
ncbi:glutaconyl-CoA decarboxylase subunit beta [Clostridia bacterium]|nr:glutaconyl-CoA decarboxylase subunit beta [Clostridia bacterium]